MLSCPSGALPGKTAPLHGPHEPVGKVLIPGGDGPAQVQGEGQLLPAAPDDAQVHRQRPGDLVRHGNAQPLAPGLLSQDIRQEGGSLARVPIQPQLLQGQQQAADGVDPLLRGWEPWALWPSASTSSPSAVSVTRTPSSVRAQAAGPLLLRPIQLRPGPVRHHIVSGPPGNARMDRGTGPVPDGSPPRRSPSPR